MTTNDDIPQRGEDNKFSADSAHSTANLLIGIVGPCGAGKTTLMEGLKRSGYAARAIVQEHSYVPDMWQRLTRPNILIFLDASHLVTCQRRRLDWTEAEYAEQQRRLAHAHKHANFHLKTDTLSIAEVLAKVIAFIQDGS